MESRDIDSKEDLEYAELIAPYVFKKRLTKVNEYNYLKIFLYERVI